MTDIILTSVYWLIKRLLIELLYDLIINLWSFDFFILHFFLFLNFHLFFTDHSFVNIQTNIVKSLSNKIIFNLSIGLSNKLNLISPNYYFPQKILLKSFFFNFFQPRKFKTISVFISPYNIFNFQQSDVDDTWTWHFLTFCLFAGKSVWRLGSVFFRTFLLGLITSWNISIIRLLEFNTIRLIDLVLSIDKIIFKLISIGFNLFRIDKFYLLFFLNTRSFPSCRLCKYFYIFINFLLT